MMKNVIAGCTIKVQGTQGFMEKMSSFVKIAKAKGVELPETLSFKEEGEVATVAFPLIKNGIELGDFQISALKTMTDKEIFDLMREEVNKIEDNTEGYFERRIQNKLSFRCNIPMLSFTKEMKQDFLKGMIAEGEAVARVINDSLEAC